MPKTSFIKPIFIIGAPRSGTSILFTTLSKSQELWSTYQESQIWSDAIPHNWSDMGEYTDSSAYTEELKELIHNYFLERARNVIDYKAVYLADIDDKPEGIRFIEKTPITCLKLDLVSRLYPDALFIYLKRNGLDVINSVLRAWEPENDSLFLKAEIPPGVAQPNGKAFQWRRLLPHGLRNYIAKPRTETTPFRWWGLLPPGWKDYITKSPAEIAAFQWIVGNESALDAFKNIARERQLTVSYEDLVNCPEKTLRRICEFADIKYCTHMEAASKLIVNQKTGWLHGKYRQQIESVKENIKPTMERMGYFL